MGILQTYAFLCCVGKQNIFFFVQKVFPFSNKIKKNFALIFAIQFAAAAINQQNKNIHETLAVSTKYTTSLLTHKNFIPTLVMYVNHTLFLYTNVVKDLSISLQQPTFYLIYRSNILVYSKHL